MTRLSALIFALACCALFSSCALFEPGGPSAAITIRARSPFEAKDLVERVFVDHRYTPILRESDGTTFEKRGTKSDRIFYGDWDDSDVTERVKIAVTPTRAEQRYRLRALSYMTRFPHDVSFEDQHRRPQLFSLRYGRLLREVRDLSTELWKGREQAEE